MRLKYGKKQAWAFRTRNELAAWYANILRYAGDVDVSELNMEIEKRWSRSGLTYIKTKAWKIYDTKSRRI